MSSSNTIKIHKRHDLQIRISQNEYNGYSYIDVRQFYLNRDDEWKPTKKGVTFPPDLIPEMVEGLKRILDNEL